MALNSAPPEGAFRVPNPGDGCAFVEAGIFDGRKRRLLCARSSHSLMHEIPKNLHLLGILLAQRQEYAAAAEKFRAYLQLAPEADDAATVRKQLAQVETALAQAKAKEQEQD